MDSILQQMDQLEVSDDPIFIAGPHKSGTSLLRSLFDGHEDLFVIPIETHFLAHAGFYVEYEYQRSSYDFLKRKNFFKNVFDWVKKSERNRDKYSDSATGGKWDLALLHALLEKAPSGDVSVRQLIDYAVKAIYLALRPKKISKRIRFVEKSVENTELAPIYKKLYPDAYFAHIVRNPYSNFLSFRRYKTYRGKYPYIKPIISSLSTYYKSLQRNRGFLDNFILVKYEELIGNPVTTMQQLSKNLDIDFCDTLLLPTSLGDKWEGNSVADTKYVGVSADGVDAWRNSISPFEIHIVNRKFYDTLLEFKFEKIEPNRHWTWPVKGESIKLYVDNRIYFCGA